jgi:hypothetical protein
MKTIIYNHLKDGNGLSLMEFEMSLHKRTEDGLRRFCITFTPETHGMAEDHILADCLPGAYRLELGAIKTLNRKLPGVVYEMPVIVNHLKRLSTIAFRSFDRQAADQARSALKQIACPVGWNRDSLPITPHMTNLVQYVAEDFHLVNELRKRMESETNASPKRIMTALKKAFAGIHPGYIDDMQFRPVGVLVRERVGEITGDRGNGIYRKWSKANPGYIKTIQQMAAEQAATMNLPL